MVSRSELATRLARGGASHAQAAHAVDAVLHEITAALVAGERVALTGFGTFEPVSRPERTARNPRTGAPVQVPAATVARFHAGAGLRAALVSGDAGPGPAGSLPPSRSGAGTAVPAAPAVAAVDERSSERPGGRPAKAPTEKPAKKQAAKPSKGGPKGAKAAKAAKKATTSATKHAKGGGKKGKGKH